MEKCLKEKQEKIHRRKEQHEEIQQLKKEMRDKEEREEREYCREYFKQEEEWKLEVRRIVKRRDNALNNKLFARQERRRGKRSL